MVRVTAHSTWINIVQSLELLTKNREEISRGSGGITPPPSPLPATKICAIWGILEANLKKCSTQQFMTNISLIPSICINRSIISIFIRKKVCLLIFFPHGKYIFPRFSIFISARILVSAMNSRLWWLWQWRAWLMKREAKKEASLCLAPTLCSLPLNFLVQIRYEPLICQKSDKVWTLDLSEIRLGMNLWFVRNQIRYEPFICQKSD